MESRLILILTCMAFSLDPVKGPDVSTLRLGTADLQ